MPAWSYSVLESFETCPYRHYVTKVAKTVVEPQSAEMAEGNRVHKALEMRVKTGEVLPQDLQKYEPMMQRFDASVRNGAAIEAEQKMTLNVGMQPAKWFAKDAWVRGITDVTLTKKHHAFIGDYKTGNPKENSGQLRLTAAMTFAHKPWITSITNAFIWLKTNTVTTQTFTREHVPMIWQEFAPRVQRFDIAYQEQKWPKRPSGLCRKWCPVPRSMCEHRGE